MDVSDYFDPHELSDRFAEVTGQATSEGGHITVMVDTRGRVHEIRLDPKLAGVSLARLAEAIATVCGRAFDNRVDQLVDIVDQYESEYGLTPEVLSFLRTSIASLRGSATRTEAEGHEGTRRAGEVEFDKPDLLYEDPLGRRRPT